MLQSQKQRQHAAPVKTTNFNGAAIIDDQGREIPITEAMVQRALQSSLHNVQGNTQERPQLTAVHSQQQRA